MASLQLLAIKPKTWRDLVTDDPFERSDIITIQDPSNLAARDASQFDYVRNEKKVNEEDAQGDPLRGINVEAAGGAGKVLKMLAEKVRQSECAESELTSVRREQSNSQSRLRRLDKIRMRKRRKEWLPSGKLSN